MPAFELSKSFLSQCSWRHNVDIKVLLCLQGIRETQERPNPHLYQAIAMLAGEMGYIDEARQWFREGTSSLEGKRSHALWHAWALMEATKVSKNAQSKLQ